jgi:hypothetical protein
LPKESNAGCIIISGFTLCYRATVTKLPSYWHKNRQVDQWNRIEDQEITSHNNSHLIWWEQKLELILWKTVWRGSSKKYTWSSNYTTEYKSKDIEVRTWRRHSTHMFTIVLLTLAKIWNQPRHPSMVKWRKKMWYVHARVCVYIEYYSAIKRNEILSFPATWMELNGIMLSQVQKDKYLTYMWKLKSWSQRSRDRGWLMGTGYSWGGRIIPNVM